MLVERIPAAHSAWSSAQGLLVGAGVTKRLGHWAATVAEGPGAAEAGRVRRAGAAVGVPGSYYSRLVQTSLRPTAAFFGNESCSGGQLVTQALAVRRPTEHGR